MTVPGWPPRLRCSVLARDAVRGGRDAEALPLVLLHGFTGDSSTWDRLLAHLGTDRSVLAIDLVGHGASDAPDDPTAYTMDATIEAILAALAAAGVARAHWLGYSMGGRVALALALARPAVVAGLVLVGTSPGIADPAERAARVLADEALADSIEHGGLEPFVDRWMASPLFATQARLGPEFLAAARAQRLRNRPHALIHTLRGMGTGAMPPLWDDLGRVDGPVLLVAGSEDPRFADLAGRMAARMPRAERLVVPGAGHAVHLEAPAELGAGVRAFLQRHEGE